MSLQRCFITNGSGPQHSGSTIWLVNHRGRGYHSAAAVIPRIALRQWANAGLAADDAGTCEGAWMFTTAIGVRYNSAGWDQWRGSGPGVLAEAGLLPPGQLRLVGLPPGSPVRGPAGLLAEPLLTRCWHGLPR